MLNCSLLASSICILMLLVLLPRPIVGVDVAVAAAWTEALQDKLDELETNELMASDVITVINSFESLNPPDRQSSPDSQWVQALVNEMQQLMDNKVAAARRLAAEVERLYISDTNDNVRIYNSLDQATWDSAFRSTLAYDDRYQQNVSFTYSTVRYPDYANTQQANAPSWTDGLDTVFRNNYNQDATLEFQYFASSAGHLRAFPGGPWAIKSPPNLPAASAALSGNINLNKNTYEGEVAHVAGFNARFQPWYVLGASGPKDVILVLDSSTSMGSMYEVRKAAINVISGLTSKDYVNVVVFNTHAAVSSCWDNRLVRATEANKEILKSYILDLETANGKTNIEEGLDLALNLLDQSVAQNQSSQCEQIVLLLTDGVTSATHFNIDNNQDARLFAYVLNLYTDTSPLQRLTCSNDGILIPVPNPSSAYLQMASYYDILSPGMVSAGPVFVGPYLNQFTGIGLVLTVTYPCYDRTQNPPTLIGVVGVDVPMDQIDALSRNFVAHPSYSFIVNNMGETIVHPHLPQGSQYRSHPKFFDIAELEGLSGNDEFDQVRRDMVQGITGSKKIDKVSQLARGMFQYEGVKSWDSTVSYFYQRLYGDMSVAIAWTTLRDTEAPELLAPVLRARVTHITPDAYHASQRESRSSFSVAAKGYCDPVWFIEKKEDEDFSQLVVSSVDAPVNASCPTELLRKEARLAIQASSNIAGVWNASFYELHPEVKVRFIATHNSGVMRTFPGHTLVTKYDPTSVDWYRRAIASEVNTLAISVPQTHSDKSDVLSSFEEGKFNTVVFSRIVPYVTADSDITTYGVMGMSVDYSHMSELFLDAVNRSCSYNPISQSKSSGIRCVWIDANGYLITHRTFLHTLPPPNSSYIFLGVEEPLLADTLITHNVITPVESIDYSTGNKVRVNTYSVVKSAFTQDNSSGLVYATGDLLGHDCLQRGSYFISKVGPTNTYMVVLNITANNLCAYYSQPNVNFVIEQNPLCYDPIYFSIPGSCTARPITSDELESLRGIQNCRSETKAILLGILIPLGAGTALLTLIWFYRRRKRMSRAGMLVANADQPGGNLDPDPNMSDANLPNRNRGQAEGMENAPSFVIDPNNHEAIAVVIQDDSSSNNNSSNTSNNTSNINSNSNNNTNSPRIPRNGNSFISNANNHANNRHSTSLALRNNINHRRTGHSSLNIRPSTPSPSNLRSSSMADILSTTDNSPYNNSSNSSNTSTIPTLSPPLGGNPYTGSIYYTEADEDLEGGRGIAMHALPSAAVLGSSPSLDNSDEGSNNDEESEEEHNEREDEEEEEEDNESERDSGSESESDEERDPDDLFAGMAREMGIALPRTARDK